MSDKHYIGLDVTSFEDTGKHDPISCVTLFLDDENYYTAGDDTGKEITASCPSATQAMADALLAKMKGYQHQSFNADAANIDPAAELGDAVTVGGIYAGLSQIKDDGYGYSNIAAPDEPELEDEYPYISPIQQEINRKSTEVYSVISKTAEEIRLEIKGLEDEQASMSLTLDGFKTQIAGKIDGETAQSMIDQSIGSISLSVSSADGSTTFTLKGGETTLDTEKLNLTVSAVNITGQLNADQINMTGAITWNDLSSGVQDEIQSNSGITKEEAKTLITSELVSSPTIAGGTFKDLTQTNWLAMGTNENNTVGYLNHYFSAYSSIEPVCVMGYVKGIYNEWVLAPYGNIVLDYLAETQTTYATGTWDFSSGIAVVSYGSSLPQRDLVKGRVFFLLES